MFFGQLDKPEDCPGLWLAKTFLLLWNSWTEFNATWREARTYYPLQSLCFSSWSEKTRWPPRPLIGWEMWCMKCGPLGFMLHSVVLNLLSKIMNSPCAKFYIIKSSNINTANIVLFLIYNYHFCTVFPLFYPKNSNIHIYSASHHSLCLEQDYELPLCKFLYHSIKT